MFLIEKLFHWFDLIDNPNNNVKAFGKVLSNFEFVFTSVHKQIQLNDKQKDINRNPEFRNQLQQILRLY